jgi:hypothetical protein
MIFSGSFVQMNDRGWSLASARKRLMADCSSIMERNTPNFSRRLVSLAKNPLDCVEPGGGRRGEVKSSAWMAFQPGAHFGMLVRGVVVPRWHGAAGPARPARVDGIEEADELLMPVLLHAASEHGCRRGYSARQTGSCDIQPGNRPQFRGEVGVTGQLELADPVRSRAVFSLNALYRTDANPDAWTR